MCFWNTCLKLTGYSLHKIYPLWLWHCTIKCHISLKRTHIQFQKVMTWQCHNMGAQRVLDLVNSERRLRNGSAFLLWFSFLSHTLLVQWKHGVKLTFQISIKKQQKIIKMANDCSTSYSIVSSGRERSSSLFAQVVTL